LLWGKRRLRRVALCVLVAVPLLIGGWLWLRDSPLVAVEHVQISGVHGVGAGAIDRALERRAKQMSTLDLQPGALRAVVDSFPQVRSLRLRPGFPHSLSIIVQEQLPVAVMLVDGQRTALAADGVVLGSSFVSNTLPVIDGQTFPSHHVIQPGTLEYLTVLGAAPGALLGLVARAYTTPKGLTLALRDGLLVYFGDGTRPHAKWLSLARVVSDPSSAGASYIDVRMPERPAAGVAGESPVAGPAQTSGLDPNSAALAQTLESAITGTASKPASAANSTAASTAGASTEAPSAEAESSATTTENPTTISTPTSTGTPTGG
jgi:cell division protein FtsQ